MNQYKIISFPDCRCCPAEKMVHLVFAETAQDAVDSHRKSYPGIVITDVYEAVMNWK